MHGRRAARSDENKLVWFRRSRGYIVLHFYHSNNMEIMEIDNEELISFILSKPAIWDSKNVHHKNKRVIIKCWEEIKRHFGNVEVAILKKRWKNLKDQYRKELKKLPTPRSGDPGDNIQSTWQFFQQMNFLRFEILPDNSDTNLTTVDSQLTSMSSPCTETNSSESVIRESDINLCSPKDSVNAQELASVGDDEVRTTNTPLSINTASSSSRSLKRKTANDIRMEMLELEKKRLLLLEKDLQQNSNANQSGESKSEDYYYLMSLLPQMESFTPLQKFNVRNRINQVMMEEIHNSMFGDPYRGNSSSSWSHGYRTQTPE